MLYAIIETKLGEKRGLSPCLHRCTRNKAKMIVNENELRLVNQDIAEAARYLGGELLSESEVFNALNKQNRNE